MLEDIPGISVHTTVAPNRQIQSDLLDVELLEPDLPDDFSGVLPDDGLLEVDDVFSFAASFRYCLLR